MTSDAGKPSRILHVISSLERGGAQAVLYHVVRGLAHRGHHQAVIYFHDGPYVSELAQLDVTLYHVHGTVSMYDPVFWVRFLRCLSAYKPDVVHASLWAACFASRIARRINGIPVVNAVHALLDHHGKLRTILDWITVAQSDQFIAVSQAIQTSLMRALRLPQSQPITCIANGVDTEYIHAAQSRMKVHREAYGLSAEHMVIGAVGRFVPVKQFDQLITVFAELARLYTHIRLLLIGEGPLEQELRACVRRCGVADKVVFVVGASALAWYPLMDCFVQPSAQEGLSIALLEAMATGRACIATGSDGCHCVITNHEDGIVVPPGNLDQLKCALQAIVSNETLRLRMGMQARNTVSCHYGIDRMVAQYESVFCKMGVSI